MEFRIRDDKRIVEIWLTNEEKKNESIRKSLNAIYKRYQKEKYTIAVFESGKGDLYSSILELLRYNQKHTAGLELQASQEEVNSSCDSLANTTDTNYNIIYT